MIFGHKLWEIVATRDWGNIALYQLSYSARGGTGGARTLDRNFFKV